MLKNVLFFFINSLKITMSIIHQTSAFIVIFLGEISLYYSAIFVGGGTALSPYPRYAMILTLFFERCAIKLSKPSFTSSLSRKNERIAKSDVLSPKDKK